VCSRNEVISTARRMSALRLVTGTFGNVSRRLGERVLITPSGLDYTTMCPGDLVLLKLSGEIAEGDRPPSSEYRLHLTIYRGFPDVGAIVHTHSPRAVEAGDLLHELPAVGACALRGSVPVAPFRPPGTQELADGAAELLAERGTNAVILERHGVVGLGQDLDQALGVCQEVERLAGRLSDTGRA